MKKKSTTAIRTDSFVGILPTQKIEEPIVLGEGSSKQEIALADIAKSAGWKELSRLISDMMAELDNGLTEQIASGASFDEIGRSAIIKEMVKGYLVKILVKVQDAAEAVDRTTREGRGESDQAGE